MTPNQGSDAPSELRRSSSFSSFESIAESLIDIYKVKTKVLVRFDTHNAEDAAVTFEHTAKTVKSEKDKKYLEAYQKSFEEWAESQAKKVSLPTEGPVRSEVELATYWAVTTDNKDTPGKASSWIGNMAGKGIDVEVTGEIFEPTKEASSNANA